MKKTKKIPNEYMREATRQICEILRDAAEQSCEHQTIWVDVDSLAFVVLGSARAGTRRTVRQILRYLLLRGDVERREFGSYVGWRMKKESSAK